MFLTDVGADVARAQASTGRGVHAALLPSRPQTQPLQLHTTPVAGYASGSVRGFCEYIIVLILFNLVSADI